MSNRLPILQSEASEAHLSSEKFAAASAEKALVAGAALVEAKSLCAHGEWGDWLGETGIPERTAQRYMSLHRAGCIPAIVADFGIVRAAEYAALGLKMYPDKGRANMSASFTYDRELGWIAYWWRSGTEHVAYTDFTITPVGGRAFFTKKPMPLIGMGWLLSNDLETYDFSNVADISECKAKAEVEEVLAA